MKKFYSFFVIAFLLCYSGVYGQTYTITYAKDAGNPPGGYVTSDLNTSGTIILGSSTMSVNQWSAVQTLPFTFYFYGAPVTQYKVSANGVLTFAVTTTAVPDSNTTLPTASLPDSSIAFMWDSFTNTPPTGSGDYCRVNTYGTAPNRQVWIWYYSYEIGNPNYSYAYWALVLEEGTNNIYIVDQYDAAGTSGTTVGVQLNSTTGVMDVNSPNIVHEPNGTSLTDNDLWTLVYTTPCVAPPTAGSATVSNATPCFGQSVNLGLTGNSIGTGQTYQWETSSSLSGPWTSVGTSSSTITFTTTPPSGNTYYRAQVTCGASTVASQPVLVTVAPAFPGGTYTIDSSLATGGTNFRNFTDAIAALSCGIGGPITFNLAGSYTRYNEQITLPATIGATATNTITFNGNGDTLSSAGSSGNYATLSLDGADYITFRNLTIMATDASDGFAVHLMNSADNNAFRNCTMIASKTATASTNAAVSMSGSLTSYSTGGGNGMNNIFDSCTTIGGYFGFVFYGSSATMAANANNSITNSNITEYYLYGSYNYYQSNATVAKNTFTRPTRASVSTGYGAYLGTGCTNMLVEKNRITNLFGGSATSTSAAYAIYVTGDGTLGNENQVYNNIIYDLGANGIHRALYLTGDYVKAYHNSIALNTNSTAGDTYGIYATGTAGVDVRNNNISITRAGSGDKWCLYFTGGGKISDNNNLFINAAGGNNYIGHTSVPAASDEATLTSWKQVNGAIWDQNSKTADPLFADLTTGDLTPGAFQLDNTGAPIGVTTDFTDAPRNPTTPDIGAYEVSIPICTGTPVAGTASASAYNVCIGANTAISLAGYTSGNGISIQWEESPSGSGSWTAISGATNSTYGPTITTATDYRATITCINGGGSDVSNVVTVSINPFYLCYCSPLTGVSLQTSSGTNYITNVSIAGTPLNVSTTSAGSGGYTQHDYTIANNTATLTQGGSYTLTATHSSTSTSIHAELWIDWDQSGTFDSVEYIPVTNSGTNDDFTFQIPFTAIPGQTGMRIRSLFSTTAAFGPNGACTSITTARETEDFVITIDAAPQCAGAPAAGVLAAGIPNVCSGSSASLSLTGYPAELGISYQWEESPAGANNFQPIANATSTSFVSAPLTASTDYRVAVTCNNPGGATSYSNIVSIGVTSILNGTYTIDADAPASATNFQSFTGAMAALNCGISGPVTFNVTSPVTKKYIEQINLASIPGINATNTITINGNGDTLSFGGSSANFATLNLSDIDYLTINDLVIDATGSANSFALHMMNGSDNNAFNNCTFLADTTGSVTTVGCVIMSGSATSYSTGGTNGSNNTFNSCTMDGGYFGFVCYGSSTATNDNNNLYNCSIRNYYTYGAYCYYLSNSTLSGNEFSRPDRTVVSSGYGIYMSTGCSNMLVERNRIHNMFDGASVSTTSVSYAIYISADATAGNENKIYNNLVYNLGGSGTHAGLYLTGSDYVKAYHNTIALNTPVSSAGTTYGIYSTGTTSIDIKNNNIYITRGGTGTKYCLYFTGAGKTSDFNNLYINAPAGTNYVGYFSSGYTTLSGSGGWQSANSNAFDQNSKSVDPIFSGIPGNYEPSHPQLNNQGTPLGITNDINGATRSTTTPDIGAYEFTPPTCISTNNLGDSTTMTSATLDWTENGSATQWQIEYGTGNFLQGTGTLLNVGTHPYTIAGLTHTTEYSFFVRAVCGVGDTSTWSARYVFNTVPANDTCSAAVNISNGLPVNGTTAGAWQTMASGSCAASTLYANDVWYYFTTFTSGNVTVTATNTTGDVVLEVLTGTCGSFTALDCQDQPSIGTETITLNNLAPGTYYVRVYGYLSIENPFVVQVTGTPLAIKLRDITAVNAGLRNRVNWSTATEATGDIFELERSRDGKEFRTLSVFNAKGEASEYSYWDETPVAGVNYYRIKTIDASGTYNYSKTVSATVKGASFQVVAYPNPVSDEITIEVQGQQGKDASILITDATGKVVRTVNGATEKTEMNLHGLAQGMYLIKYSDAEHSQVIKVNKQ